MPIKIINWGALPTCFALSISNILVLLTPVQTNFTSFSKLAAQELTQNSQEPKCGEGLINDLNEVQEAFNFDNKLNLVPLFLLAQNPVENKTNTNQQELKLKADNLFREAAKPWFGGQFRTVVDKLEQSLVIRQQLKDRLGEGAMLLGLAVLHNTINESSLAFERSQKALAIFQELGFRAGEGLALVQIGFANYGIDEYEKSLLNFQQAIAIHEEIVEEAPQEGSWQDFTSLTHQLLEEDLDLTKVIKLIHKHLGKSVVYGFMGRVYRNQEDYVEALEVFSQEIAIHRKVGFLSGQGKALKQMGTVYEGTAQYPKALRKYAESIEVYRQAKYIAGEAPVLRDLARIYFTLGEHSQAKVCYQQAFELYKKMGHPDGQGDSLFGLGLVSHDQGKYQEAVEYYQKALVFHYGADDYNGAENALRALGRTYIEQGKYPEALEVFHQSIEMSEKMGNVSGKHQALRFIGIVYDKQGDYELAVKFLEQAYELEKSIKDLTGQGNVLSTLGATHKNFGKLAKAEETLQNAIEVWESIRLSLDRDEKVSLLEVYKETYQNLQKVQVDQGKIYQALETSEKGRTRVLVELLARQLDPQADELPQPEAPRVEQMVQIAQEQNATLVEYSIVEDGSQLLIWVIQPTGEIHFRSIEISFDAIGLLNSLSSELENLRGDTLLASLVRGTQQSLREENNGNPQASDSSEDELPLYPKQLRQLHKILIEPITNLLPKNPDDRVIFIPHQELFLVPFAALQDENHDYLIEKHTILTAPSVQSLSYTRQHRQRIQEPNQEKSVALIVGNPELPESELIEKLERLPGAEEEAIEIAALLNTNNLLLGNNATETEVVQRMRSANIVHLATHGILDTEDYEPIPGLIVLAPSENQEDDGLLRASEIVELTSNNPLNTELMVLSACKTGLGQIMGEGVYGLSYSLITAGVPSLVVSLWQVNDQATKEFMLEFYLQLQETGDKAQALRQAMLKAQEGRYSDPGFWAAFTLIGEAE